ncbi:Fc.00g009080.m01.CDS01 [Cosmosporella sp. VM-42]
MDPSQNHQHQHHHHHRGHHQKSLSQQQSSSSLSSTNRLAQQLHTHLPSSASMPMRTANSTPMSSPGLFSPSGSRQNLAFPPQSASESNTPSTLVPSPFLHPLQMHKVRETHKALIDSDNITGRKLINQYEVIEEIGRGMHGKVKLARNVETGGSVAIKIIPRFSKKRRLGKVTARSPQDKTKKEIAILKKIRHPNVVALLEVIDDPELKKIYMVLEHVELGEVVWRKKGLPHIAQFERRRIEREMRGEAPTPDEVKYEQHLERRRALKQLKRARMAQHLNNQSDFWSVEHGAGDEPSSSLGSQSRISSREDFAVSDGPPSRPESRQTNRPDSRAPSRSRSALSARYSEDLDESSVDWEDDMETPGPLRSNPTSSVALDGTMYGAYIEEGFRGRSPSMADSIISHMSSIDYNPQQHDPFADDFSYVPCFTIDQARSTFRDTVLGLEYLHYQGVVHRDIKPANLLWSKEHRVKISDFGVSYFGRPIRDGELDDTVSESEARDFDDDLELAKTVGTPAFFAPELCYTDLDIEQPKVSEQIDVWSLGVTLYCLIYARIPFLAEDEFQMFRKIATEEVYIPRRRLKPVDPLTSPAGTSLYKRRNTHPYRDDNDLEYEEVDNLLCDLLRQMLTKNPEKRIRLRDIKRHPWVVQGISNVIAWLDDTDPARPSSGRRIQVDEREMSSAVVPLTFLERARSVVKKAVGKVMHPLVERSDSKTRRRATSSAASSAGDSMYNNVPPTPSQNFRDHRRKSLRPDDYFANAIRDSSTTTEHPLASSQTASPQPESVVYDPLATVLPSADTPRGHSHAHGEESVLDTEKSHSTSSMWPLFHRHTHSHGGKLTNHFFHLGPPLPVSQTTPTTPYFDGTNDGQDSGTETIRKARDMDSATDDSSRSRSVDRGLFASSDKRASPKVALSNAVADGSFHGPSKHARNMRSVDLVKDIPEAILGSPLFTSSPKIAAAYQNSQPQSDPNMHDRQQASIDERPRTAHRVETSPDVRRSLPPQVCNRDNRESFATRHQEAVDTCRERRMEQAKAQADQPGLTNGSGPPSPDEEEWMRGTSSRGGTGTTTKSSSTESMEGFGTPLTSPSEVTSPTSAMPCPKNRSDRMLAFRSDPSLPALLSGASSVSADMEAEYLCRPGVVSAHPSLLETTDSLTPPALTKEPAGGFPIDHVFGNAPAMESGPLALHLEPSGSQDSVTSTPVARPVEDEDDDDGSDDGILLMAKAKKKPAPSANAVSRAPPFSARRRDTNISIASTETAKKIPVHGDEGTSHYEP